MTSSILKLKVKSMRAYNELREVVPFTQYDDIIGFIDNIAVEECERILAEMKDIHEQQCALKYKELSEYETKYVRKKYGYDVEV
tara:strand:- start:825 stop:1076 length:252 start_codon:yes stop_codon:yes gene_type:complete